MNDSASYTQVTGKLDLIDRQAAIEWCLEGLNNMPSAEPEPHWIPVTERLPEVGEYVLCSQINGDVGEGKMYGNEKWHICYDDSIYKKEWVEAWQPLPEPYKEEGEHE